MGGIIFFAIAIGLIVLLYKLIHMSGPIGTMFRWSWNIIMTVFTIIPGFGFMAGLIVTDDKEAKEKIVKAGEEADRETHQRWQQEKEARLAAEDNKPEVEVYKEHYHDGWVDREKMKVSRDGERYYDSSDGKWHKIEDSMRR